MNNLDRLNELSELPDEWREFVFNELMSEEEREEFINSIHEFIAQTMRIVEQATPVLMQLGREIMDQFSQGIKSTQDWLNSLPPELVKEIKALKMTRQEANNENR